MKRLFVLLVMVLSVVLLSACTLSEQQETTATLLEQENVDSITFEKGEYSRKDWNDPTMTYKGVAVPDKETALEIAKAIFNGMEKGPEEQELEPKHIFYDEQEKIWIVTFSNIQIKSDEIITGICCSIAIQETDGKVLRIWFDE